MKKTKELRMPSPALSPEYDAYVDDAVGLAMGTLTKARAAAVRGRMKHDDMYRAVVKPIVDAYKTPDLSREDMDIAWPVFARDAGMPIEAVEALVGSDDAREMRGLMRIFGSVGKLVTAVVIVIGGVLGNMALMNLLYFERVSTSPRGTLREVLPDSSVVVLGPSSSLKYRDDMKTAMGHYKRDTWFSGEGTFAVRSDSTQLFEVNTNQAQLIALGTRFRIVARDRVTTVVMEEGRMTIRRINREGREEGRMEVVKPGQTARITHEVIDIRSTP